MIRAALQGIGLIMREYIARATPILRGSRCEPPPLGGRLRCRCASPSAACSSTTTTSDASTTEVTRHRIAVDRRDHDLSRHRHQRGHILRQVLVPHMRAGSVSTPLASHFRLLPAQKRTTATRNHDHADLAARLGGDEHRVVQCRERRAVERVHPFGTIQRDDADARRRVIRQQRASCCLLAGSEATCTDRRAIVPSHRGVGSTPTSHTTRLPTLASIAGGPSVAYPVLPAPAGCRLRAR